MTTLAASSASHLLKIFGLGLVLRTFLLLVFPVPYGEDGFGRLYFRSTLFLSHWLPLTQLVVYVTALLSEGIFFTRYVFAILGSLAGCGFYLFMRLLVSPQAALWGGLLFSVNSLFVMLSLMPYQDVLFLGLFYAALAFLADRTDSNASASRFTLGTLLLGLACLTRYEAWFILPLLAFSIARQEAPRGELGKLTHSITRSALFLGWGPLLWLLLSKLRFGTWDGFLYQTSDASFYAWNPHVDLLWMAQYALRLIYWLGLFGSPVILLAIPGLLRLIQLRGPTYSAFRLLSCFGLVVLVFFFVIIGKEQDTVFRFVVIPLSIALVLTVIGLEFTMEWSSRIPLSHFRRLVPATLLVLLAIYAIVPIAKLNENPKFRDPYLITRYLEQELRSGETALVVADRSRDLTDTAPILYQRIAGQSRLARNRVLSSGLLDITDPADLLDYLRNRRVRFLVIFEDFDPWLPSDRFYAGLTESSQHWIKPVLEMTSARVFLLSAWPTGHDWDSGDTVK